MRKRSLDQTSNHPSPSNSPPTRRRIVEEKLLPNVNELIADAVKVLSGIFKGPIDLENMPAEMVDIASLLLHRVFKVVNLNTAWSHVLKQVYCLKENCDSEVREKKALKLLIVNCAQNDDFSELFNSGMFNPCSISISIY